jgi:predicted DNA binding CopG/RHH family protein
MHLSLKKSNLLPIYKRKCKDIGRSQRQHLKDKRINIRIANRDLLELQKVALVEGIPYQTFITRILHKFVDGKYTEKRP